jgi:hypothetical protein
MAQATFCLIAGVIVRLIQPQCWPRQVRDDVAKPHLTNGGLGRLDGCQDRNDADLGIDQRLKRFLQPWRVVGPESSRDGRVRDGVDMLLRPSPRRASIRRAPGFQPDRFELIHSTADESTRGADPHAGWCEGSDRRDPATSTRFDLITYDSRGYASNCSDRIYLQIARKHLQLPCEWWVIMRFVLVTN